MKRVLIIVLLVIAFFRTGFATDPVVNQAIEEAKQKYPPGDYLENGRPINGLNSPTSRSDVFEVHAVAEARDATKKWYSLTRSDGSTETLFLEPEVLLNQASVKAAWVEHDSNGQPIVRLILTGAGAQKFSELTGKLVDKRIGLVFEGRLISAPVIKSQIFGGQAIIAGNMSETEAADTAVKLQPAESK